MYNKRDILMTMEDGSSLGVVSIKDSTIYLWARKVNQNGYMGWVQDRAILLNNLLDLVIPTAYTCGQVNIIRFVEGLDILLLGEDAIGFLS